MNTHLNYTRGTKDNVGKLTLSENLLDWLELSWFYPEDFKKKYIIQNSSAYLVVGESLTYKFLKHQLGSSTEQKRVQAQREIQDNRELAPNLYLGSRHISWNAEDPEWLSQEFVPLNAESLTKSVADEISIVMRSVPPEALLSEHLSGSGIHIERIYKILRRFHSRRKREGRNLFLEKPKTSVREILDRWLRSIPYIENVEDHGDFFASVFNSARARLIHNISALESTLLRRGRMGELKWIHGSVRTNTISVEQLSSDSKPIQIFNRKKVLGDALEDFAELSVDLLLRGAKTEYRVLRNRIKADVSEEEFSLFMLLLSLRGLSRIGEEIESTSADFSSLLSVLFLAPYTNCSTIVVCTETGAQNYAQALASFLDCNVLKDSVAPNYISNQWVLDDQLFLDTLERAKHSISNSENLVVRFNFSGLEQRDIFSRELKKLGAQVHFVSSHAALETRKSPISRRNWTLSKTALSSSEAWRYVADFLSNALLSQNCTIRIKI